MNSIPDRKLDERTLSSPPKNRDPRFTSPQRPGSAGGDPRFTNPQRRSPAAANPGRRSPAGSNSERVDPDRPRSRNTATESEKPTTRISRAQGSRRNGSTTGDESGGRPVRPSGYVAVLVAYGVLKAIGFAVFLKLLAVSGQYQGKNVRTGGGHHLWDVVGSWDGWSFQQAAAHGYHLQPISSVGDGNLFPLYPDLIRVVTLGGLDTYGAGMLVSVVFSFVAAAGVFAVTARLRGNRAGVIAAGLWAVFPGSGSEWAVYSESLFVALAAWSLYAVLTRHWFTAGALACLAGLTSYTAVALVTVVSLAALVALVRRQQLAGPLVAFLIAPAGLFAVLRLDRRAWQHGFDWGRHTWHASTQLLLGRGEFANLTGAVLGLMLVLALPGLLVLLIRLRPPLVITAYTVLSLVLILGSNQGFDHISRYLLLVFPLLIPLAAALRRLKLPSLSVLLAMAAAASGWFAGFALFELGTP